MISRTQRLFPLTLSVGLALTALTLVSCASNPEPVEPSDDILAAAEEAAAETPSTEPATTPTTDVMSDTPPADIPTDVAPAAEPAPPAVEPAIPAPTETIPAPAPSSTDTMSAPDASIAPGTVCYVKSNKTRVYEQPADTAKVVDTFDKGDHFVVRSVQGEWIETPEGLFLKAKGVTGSGVGRRRATRGWGN